MAVYLDTDRHALEHRPMLRARATPFATQADGDRAHSLHIGLINNMPDAALQETERQFHSLLAEACEGISIRLSFYAMPGIPREGLSARRVEKFYASTENLRDAHLDGLIVTGREPRTANLHDEPYWKSFTETLEWAKENTHSTIWSCLAAHAAILHMDGIQRIRSATKHSGVFNCTRVSDDMLMAGAPSQFKLPHSRWNGIAEKDLRSCGYSVLTRSAEVGVDTFVRHQKSLFVFFQGHPEYKLNALMLEYRRDVARYLRREIETYPTMPSNYFDRETTNALEALQSEAVNTRCKGLLAEISAKLKTSKLDNTWCATGACMYRNWIQYICRQKQLGQPNRKAVVSALADAKSTRLQIVSALNARSTI